LALQSREIVAEIENEDSECAKERNKANTTTDAHQYTLLARELSKSYGDHLALKSFCLTLSPGECFGLLGPNGAGKTTLISILCGMHAPTSGDAWICGASVTTEMLEVREFLGYARARECRNTLSKYCVIDCDL
jgi:ABC-type branched-subunit amino acid transport system ATPase component